MKSDEITFASIDRPRRRLDLVQPHHHLVDLLITGVGEASLLSDQLEPAFLKDANGTEVVFRSASVQGTVGHVRQEEAKRRSPETTPPILAINPIGYLEFAVHRKAGNVSSNAIHDEDRAHGYLLIGTDPGPSRVVRHAVDVDEFITRLVEPPIVGRSWVTPDRATLGSGC